MSLRFVSFLLL